ncbi:MAG: RNA methyltransferase, partial [candidate division Zixibacteria bacterium]|nr:RNA methyltransferase [candidate division Zixibacteria bacterium]
MPTCRPNGFIAFNHPSLREATKLSVTKKELKDIKSLLSRKGRRGKKMFTAEGIKLLEEAARHRFWPRSVYYSPALLTDRGYKLVERFRKHRLPIAEITAKNLQFISDTRTPQGVVAVFDLPRKTLSELYRPGYRTLLLCENISDPGNLGTLARSALAFGFRLLLLVGSCADPYSPKVIRSSAGAIFALGLAPFSVDETAAFATSKGLRLIAADVKGRSNSNILRRRLKGERILLAVGSEATGLSESILQQADYRLR